MTNRIQSLLAAEGQRRLHLERRSQQDGQRSTLMVHSRRKMDGVELGLLSGTLKAKPCSRRGNSFGSARLRRNRKSWRVAKA
uniref:Uncharacterized protein n=1 Tax=Oryza meridionalis TaxID=40149 RepID=A0A0E0F0G6_9ORYZ